MTLHAGVLSVSRGVTDACFCVSDDAGERSQEADDEGIERDSGESENDEDALGGVIKVTRH